MVDGAPGALQSFIVMCLEADRRVCMLDRAAVSNDFFWFSTTERKWEQLNATRVSGSPPSPRDFQGMVAVGSDLYVFGGSTNFEIFGGITQGGDRRRCDAGIRLGACQIERLGAANGGAAVLVSKCCARQGCHAVPHQSLLTRISGRHITPLMAP
jgi:hypothetical protein